jgi:hypothetical protein
MLTSQADQIRDAHGHAPARAEASRRVDLGRVVGGRDSRDVRFVTESHVDFARELDVVEAFIAKERHRSAVIGGVALAA